MVVKVSASIKEANSLNRFKNLSKKWSLKHGPVDCERVTPYYATSYLVLVLLKTYYNKYTLLLFILAISYSDQYQLK